MSIRISHIVSARTQPVGLLDWIRNIEVPMLGESRGPIAWLELIRVTTPALGSRLGAGVSAVTYVLQDSDTSVRIRDSLGHDTAMRPGGLLWMQAGSGVAHEHLPAERGKVMHCLHVCLSRELTGAQAISSVYRVDPELVPEWRNSSGDSVRIVAGSYAGLVSPATQEHSFTLLDVRLRSMVYFDVREDHHALVYVLSGSVLAISDEQVLRLQPDQAFVLHNARGKALLQLVGRAQLLILAGPATRKASHPGTIRMKDLFYQDFCPAVP